MAEKGEKPKLAKIQGITFDATEEQIHFYHTGVKRKHVQNKKNMTRSINMLGDLVKEDPNVEETFAKGVVLMKQADERFEELQVSFDYLVSLDDIDDEEDFIHADENFIAIKSKYKVWTAQHLSHRPPPSKPGGPSDMRLTASAINFDIRKTVREQFSGDGENKASEYASWVVHWELALKKMLDMGYSPAECLQELKKAVKGTALKMISGLPDKDGNLGTAMELLKQIYEDTTESAEQVIRKVFQVPRMGQTSESLMTTFSAMMLTEQTIKGMDLDDSEKCQILFMVLYESKLSNVLIKAWTEKKLEMADSTRPLGHTATIKDMFALITQQNKILGKYAASKQMDLQSTKEDKKDPRNDPEKTQRQGRNQTFNQKPWQGTSSQRQDGGAMPRKVICVLCKKDGHSLLDCYMFKNKKTGGERRKLLEEQRVSVCRNCLKGPHSTRECRQPPGCQCGGKHHAALHDDNFRQGQARQAGSSQRQQQPLPLPAPGEATGDGPKHSLAVRSQANKQLPILQSCQAWLMGQGSEKILARIFLDSGSEITMIRRDLAEQLGLQGPSIKFQMSVAGGGLTDQSVEKQLTIQLLAMDHKYTTQKMSAVTTKVITRDLRPINLDLSQYPHLKDLNFTETFPRAEVQVDVLIGVQYYNALLTGEIRRGKPDEPIAIGTKLGYILTGSA